MELDLLLLFQFSTLAGNKVGGTRHYSDQLLFLSLCRNQMSKVNLILTFILSLEWTRSEKELKDGSTACVTAIAHFDITPTDRGSSKSEICYFLFILLFFNFSHIHLGLRYYSVKPLSLIPVTLHSALKGRRSKFPKLPPFLHTSPAISLSSLLSISVSCKSHFKSPFFM